MATVAYIRVSTIDQNTARQKIAIDDKYKVDKYFEEKASAKDANRPKLHQLLDYVREGDTVIIESFSRLARSTKDLLAIIEYLDEKEVSLISVKEGLDLATSTGRLMLKMLSAINDFERENMLERQKEGIAIAKAEGKYKGRKKIEVDEEKFREVWEKFQRREIKSKAEVCRVLEISSPKLYRILKELNIEY